MRKVIYNEKEGLIDSGIFFGRGVFETILLKGRPHFLSEHIKRLNFGIEVLSIGEPIDSELVLDIINKNKLDNLALKVIVTEKNIIFTTRNIKYKEEDYIKGFKVKISENIRNSKSSITYIKSLNYLDNLLEYEKANIEGFIEALFLNENSMLSEGCTTNVFIIKNNNIYTPLEKCGLLKGVVREFVLQNFDVYEKEISKEELLDADEVFLTNSLVGIIKVSEIEGKKYSCKIIDEIRRKYESFINVRRSNING